MDQQSYVDKSPRHFSGVELNEDPPSAVSIGTPTVKWYARHTRRTKFLILLFCVTLYMIYSYALETTAITASLDSIWGFDVAMVQGKHVPPRKVVDRNESSFPKESAPMGWDQVQHILDNLPLDGNLLVWGLGNDSPFWNTATSGTVVFLEDDKRGTNRNGPTDDTKLRRFDLVEQHPELQVYAVNYRTRNTPLQRDRYQNHPSVGAKPCAWTIFPDLVWNTVWDVILVDAPMGYIDSEPGRFQSIYMTKLLLQRRFQLMGLQIRVLIIIGVGSLASSQLAPRLNWHR